MDIIFKLWLSMLNSYLNGLCLVRLVYVICLPKEKEALPTLLLECFGLFRIFL